MESSDVIKAPKTHLENDNFIKNKAQQQHSNKNTKSINHQVVQQIKRTKQIQEMND